MSASKVALFVCWVSFAAVAYNIYSEVAELSLIDHLEVVESDPEFEYDAETIERLKANEERQKLARWGSIGAVAVGTLLLLVWVYRTNRACRELGARNMRFKPGEAIVYWFIPFVNLIRPYQVVKELWTTTDEGGRSSTLLLSWWLTWITSGAISRYARGIAVESGASLDDYRHADYWYLVSHALDLIAFALTIIVITTLTKKLLSYRERVGAPQAEVVARASKSDCSTDDGATDRSRM